jgi:hypothetical protein
MHLKAAPLNLIKSDAVSVYDMRAQGGMDFELQAGL